jgi:hypothetical protein
MAWPAGHGFMLRARTEQVAEFQPGLNQTRP